MNRLIRKGVVTCLLLCVALAAGAQAKTTVTLWDFLSGGDGVRWKQIINEFNQSQAEIVVEATTFTWGDPFYTKVHTAVVAGETPDVMTYHLSHFPAGIRARDLRPITEAELKSVGLASSSFNPVLVQTSQEISKAYGKAGVLYGVPLDIHTWIVYYNKDILKKAGLLGSDGKPLGLTGIENFTKAMQKIKSSTNLIPAVQHIAGGGDGVWRMWFTLFSQQGGSLASGGKVTLGQLDAYGKTALQTMRDWTSQGLLADNIDYGTATALFYQGKAAFMFNGNWEVPTVVDMKAKGELPFSYGVMAFPQLYANPSTWSDSHQLAIPNNTKRPISADKLKKVLTFIAYVMKRSDVWAGGGHLPAYLPVLNGPALAKMVPNNEYSVQAAKQAILEPVNPIFGVGAPTYNAVYNFLNPGVSGQLSVAAAIAGFKAQLASE